jgi:hypothetical protein
MGIPSLFFYRDDLSLGMLYGIDPRSDYLNPTTWTKDFGLFFKDVRTPVQWRVGNGLFEANYVYVCPLQLILSRDSGAPRLITDLVQEWRRVNDYQVEHLWVRSHDDALRLFLDGRKKTSMWNGGMGYQIQADPGGRFITMGEQGLNAYFEYLAFEFTEGTIWRERSFQQANFALKAQVSDPSDPNHGAFRSNYELVEGAFDSADRGANPGFKLDLNMMLVHYLLLLWERVKSHEGVDHREWYDAAIRSIEWVRRHQNPDGGLPQKLDPSTNSFCESVTPGRALVALLEIVRITRSDEYRNFMEDLENWTYSHNDEKFHFFGAHFDLPPHELEESSLWNVTFYNLTRYEQTGERKYLDRAIAEAALGFTWNCPKQLSWVQNPTQFASAEQQDFVQYCVYNYEDTKTTTMFKLFEITRDPLYLKLFNRISQNIYFTQLTSGDAQGATYERIADPWLARSDSGRAPAFNSMGTAYMGQLGVEHFCQIALLFRFGRDLYIGRDLSTRVYADGACTYSRSIYGLNKASLAVLPDRGSTVVEVLNFSGLSRRWSESFEDVSVGTQNHLWDLKPNAAYSIYAGGQLYRTAACDRQGRLSFQLSLAKAGKVTLEVMPALPG